MKITVRERVFRGGIFRGGFFQVYGGNFVGENPFGEGRENFSPTDETYQLFILNSYTFQERIFHLVHSTFLSKRMYRRILPEMLNWLQTDNKHQFLYGSSLGSCLTFWSENTKKIRPPSWILGAILDFFHHEMTYPCF